MTADPRIEIAARALFVWHYVERDDASTEWAQGYWHNCANLPHTGDCPHAELKGPITCDRCVCDEFRTQASALFVALDAARPEVEADVCGQIMDIMATWREQMASPNGLGTPGGLEHMGDVWNLFWKWDEALTAARAPVAPDAWLPIQTAPRDGTLVLLWNKGAVEPFLARYANDRWQNNHYGEREVGWYFANPTHWQPSPNPPTEATGEKR